MFGNVVYIPSTNEAGGEGSILEKDGINTTSNKSHDLGNNTLSLNNGQFHLPTFEQENPSSSHPLGYHN